MPALSPGNSTLPATRRPRSRRRLQPGEEESLKAALARLRHVGEITEALGSATASLEDEGGAGDALRTALGHVDAAERIDDSLADLASRLKTVLTDLDDIGTRSPPRHRLDRPRPIRTCGSRRTRRSSLRSEAQVRRHHRRGDRFRRRDRRPRRQPRTTGTSRRDHRGGHRRSRVSCQRRRRDPGGGTADGR